jgi:hypothetical protein
MIRGIFFVLLLLVTTSLCLEVVEPFTAAQAREGPLRRRLGAQGGDFVNLVYRALKAHVAHSDAPCFTQGLDHINFTREWMEAVMTLEERTVPRDVTSSYEFCHFPIIRPDCPDWDREQRVRGLKRIWPVAEAQFKKDGYRIEAVHLDKSEDDVLSVFLTDPPYYECQIGTYDGRICVQKALLTLCWDSL